jgi:integrase
LEWIAQNPQTLEFARVSVLSLIILYGEAAALSWADVNSDEGTIRINKSRQYIPTVGSFDKSTKTQSGNRIISIPATLTTLLWQYRKLQLEERLKYGELWEESGKIFTGNFGRPVFPSTPSKWFAAFLFPQAEWTGETYLPSTAAYQRVTAHRGRRGRSERQQTTRPRRSVNDT